MSLWLLIMMCPALQTYGVQQPVESGFAYAQFMCQYTCNGAKPQGNSFYVNYGKYGSPYCACRPPGVTADWNTSWRQCPLFLHMLQRSVSFRPSSP